MAYVWVAASAWAVGIGLLIMVAAAGLAYLFAFGWRDLNWMLVLLVVLPLMGPYEVGHRAIKRDLGPAPEVH